MLRNLAVLVPLASWGCVCSHGEYLPQLCATEVMAGERLPAVSYRCTYDLSETFSKEEGFPAPATEQLFRSAFVAAYPPPDESGLHLDLSLRLIPYDGALPATYFTGILFVITFGIVPAYVGMKLALEVKVSRAGEQVREYSYFDTVYYSVGWLLIPFTSANWRHEHDREKIQNEVIDNLLLYFLRDLRQDLPQILELPLPGAPSAGGGE